MSSGPAYSAVFSEAPQPDFLNRAAIIAVILHALVVLGIDFGWDKPTPASSRLEVTLTSLSSLTPPDSPDFVADADQRGSGDSADRAIMTSERIFTNPADDGAPAPQLLAAAPEHSTPERAIITSKRQDLARPEPDRQPSPTVTDAPDGNDDLTRIEREIDALEARLDVQTQALAKAPRVRRLTSVSTKRAEDAAYLNSWRKKIETVGNRNYPLLAAREHIEGELRLLVTLLPDGSVHEVKTLKSSGRPVLDRAALRIVYLAQPFEPFTPGMRKSMDRLEIIRTWRFEQSTLTAE